MGYDERLFAGRARLCEPANPNHPRSDQTKMRILLIEDEKKAAAFIQKGLREHGMFVEVAEDGSKGLTLARTGSFDLAILDVMLPESDGWTVLTALRKSGSQMPVLFLTARDSVEDRVKGLELGADDYLVKPFAFSELLARVKTVLRRNVKRHDEKLRIGDLEIDPGMAKATRAGRHLHLTPKEVQLLALLARNTGEPVSRAAIADAVWGTGFDTNTNMIEAAVRRLRGKVDEPFKIKFIHNVRGVGYMFEAR